VADLPQRRLDLSLTLTRKPWTLTHFAQTTCLSQPEMNLQQMTCWWRQWFPMFWTPIAADRPMRYLAALRYTHTRGRPRKNIRLRPRCANCYYCMPRRKRECKVLWRTRRYSVCKHYFHKTTGRLNCTEFFGACCLLQCMLGPSLVALRTLCIYSFADARMTALGHEIT